VAARVISFVPDNMSLSDGRFIETPRVTHQNEIGERNLPHKLLIPNFMRPVWR
jgi:hypothetical protein